MLACPSPWRFVRGLVLLLALPGFAAGQGSPPTLDDARSLQRAGRTRDAVDAYGAVAERLESADPASAAIAHNNRCVLLQELGELTPARLACERALALRRGLDDPRRLARTLNNLGLVLAPLGEVEEAEAVYREALEINRALGEVEGEVVNLSNLGLLLEEAARYGDALSALRRAAGLAREFSDAPWSSYRWQVARINEGVVLEKLGAYREALQLYDDLLVEDLDDRARASRLVNRGVMLRNLGDPQRALAAFEEAVAIFEAHEDLSSAANAWINVGRARNDLGRRVEAVAAFTRALDQSVRGGDRREEIEVLIRLGLLRRELHELAGARDAFEQALSLASEADLAEGRWSALFGLGQLAEDEGALEVALQHYEASLEVVEGTRTGIQGASLRSGYLVDKRPIYAGAVRVLAAHEARAAGSGAEDAFAWAQRAKARELLEALGGGELALRPQKASDLQPLLVGSTLLEIFVGDRRTWVFRVDQERVEIWDAGSSRELAARVDEVYRALRRGGASSQATALASSLLGPLGKSPPRALVIAPDRFFHYLPFPALPWPADPDRALIEVVPLGELPSGSALRRPLRAPAPSAPELVAFGAPHIALDRAPDLGLALTAELPPLAGAAREVEELARSSRGRSVVRTGEAATEEAFRAAVEGSGARWIHLASHALVTTRGEGGAAVLLAPSQREDGVLRPSEIASLDAPAALTFLAACRTALGGEESGRAFASLTGAFLVAGSQRVVATRWDVGDEATAVMSGQLYHHLRAGRGVAEAMRRAQATMRADARWKRPDLWAGFVVIGEPEIPGGGRATIWLAGGLVAAILGAGWLARRRHL